MFSDRDYKLFNVARSVAATSRHYKASVGAVVVDNKSILSVGVNGEKSHPLQVKYNIHRFGRDNTADHLLHAELDAIIKARRQHLPHAAIYVYRVMKDGNVGMSRPCKGCMAAMRDFKIKDVYYTTPDGLAYEHLT